MTEIKRYNINGIDYVDYDDHLSAIKAVEGERDELRRKLAIYEDGRPSTITLNSIAKNIMDGYVDLIFRESAENASDWLKRIAAFDDKGSV